MDIRDLHAWPPEVEEALTAVRDIIRSEPRAIICVDGRDGSGKTTFGHWLAYQTGVGLVQMDHFLTGGVFKHSDLLSSLLKQRRAKGKATIVDGVFCNELLSDWGIVVSLTLRIIRTGNSGSKNWPHSFDDYEEKYPAQCQLFLPCHGAERSDQACFMLAKPTGTGLPNTVNPCRYCESQTFPSKRSSTPWDP